jgi:hypothetical protein
LSKLTAAKRKIQGKPTPALKIKTLMNNLNLENMQHLVLNSTLETTLHMNTTLEERPPHVDKALEGTMRDLARDKDIEELRSNKKIKNHGQCPYVRLRPTI